MKIYPGDSLFATLRSSKGPTVAAHPAVRPEDAALSLTMAMVEASRCPLLLLDGDLVVVAASLSFCELAALDPRSVGGRKLSDLGLGGWSDPELHERLESALHDGRKIDGYEMELQHPDQEPREILIHTRNAWSILISKTSGSSSPSPT